MQNYKQTQKIIDNYIKLFSSDIDPENLIDRYWNAERKIEGQDETISYLKQVVTIVQD